MSPTPSSTHIPSSQHSSKNDEILQSSSLSDFQFMNISNFNLPTSPPSHSSIQQSPLTTVEEVKCCKTHSIPNSLLTRLVLCVAGKITFKT